MKRRKTKSASKTRAKTKGRAKQRQSRSTNASGRARSTSFAVKQVKPRDEELVENWVRDIGDPMMSAVHGVEATKRIDDTPWRWRVSIWAMEHVREVPLEAALRRGIADALRALDGVEQVAEEDRGVWVVRGKPDGAQLVTAAAKVVDARAGEIAKYVVSR